jgi:hypothetical protein
LEGRCSNHFELAFTAFEFLLSFGQAYENAEPSMHTRLILTPPAAQTLARMLTSLVDEYEQSVGAIRQGTVASGGEYAGS